MKTAILIGLFVLLVLVIDYGMFLGLKKRREANLKKRKWGRGGER